LFDFLVNSQTVIERSITIMMVSMNAFQPNFAALQATANPANNVAQVKAQAEAVKMQADALETQAKTSGQKSKTKPAHAGFKLDLQA
jgi:predicted lactoylglutathione lyase